MDAIRKSKDNLCHIDRLGLARRTEDKCSVCGKTFYRTGEHVYKHYRKGREVFECSWTCYREMGRRMEGEGLKRSKVVFADNQGEEEKQDEPMSRVEFCKAKIEHYRRIYRSEKANTKRKRSAKQLINVWKVKLSDEKMKERIGKV